MQEKEERIADYGYEIEDSLLTYWRQDPEYNDRYMDALTLFDELSGSMKGPMTAVKYETLRKSGIFNSTFGPFYYSNFGIEERFKNIPGYREYINGLVEVIQEKSNSEQITR